MKQIVIAPQLAQRNLFATYRNNNPFEDVKFFTKESFLSEFKYKYSQKAIFFVADKYQLQWELASDYLKTISSLLIESSDYPKIAELIKIKNELIKENLLQKNILIDFELKNAKINVHFYSNKDPELLNVLQTYNYEFINFESIEQLEVTNFSTNNDQLFYLFNEISSLLESGVSYKDIAIFGISDEDRLSYERLRKSFGLNFNNVYRENMLSKAYVVNFLLNLRHMSLTSALEIAEKSKEDESYPSFIEIVNKFTLRTENNVIQESVYRNLFSSTYLEKEVYKEAINIVNEPICPAGGHLFIINFNQNIYPSLIRNNGYLSNKERRLANLVTTDDINTGTYEFYKNCLYQPGNIHILYPNKTSRGVLLPSSFIKSIKMNVLKKNSYSVVYSKLEADLLYGSLLDLERYYLDVRPSLLAFKNTYKIPYRTYDNSFNGVIHKNKDFLESLSYSALDTYYKCKYSFYLERVAKIDDSEANFFSTFGSVCHYVLEKIDENKTFDELFDDACKKYENKMGKYDWVLYKRLKEDLRFSFNKIKEFEAQVTNPHIQREIKLSIPLNEKTIFNGRLDKVITCGPNNEYVLVVDYKTSDVHFKESQCKFGLSLQLPIYTFMLQNSDDFKEKEVIGLFIQNVINRKKVQSKEEAKDNETKDASLNGVFCDDKGALLNVDSSFVNGPSKYIETLKTISGGALYKSGRAHSKEWFTEIGELAKSKILEAKEDLVKNDFEINPKKIKKDDKSCTYCAFKDICFRKEKDYVVLNDEEEEEGSGENVD